MIDGEQFEVIDKDGSKVTNRLVSLPNMRSIPKKGDDHKRKVYLSGVGTTNSEELGKHLIAQEEVIKTNGVEVWVAMNADKVSRNFGFLQMDSEEAAVSPQ